MNKTIEKIIEESLEELCKLKWESEKESMKENESKLIFPKKTDTKKRISEQEARFLFVKHFEKDGDGYYSVETPTMRKYRFTGGDSVPKLDEKNGQSANIDVCIHDNNRVRIHQIEFKFGNCEQKDIEKDFLKLLCDDPNEQSNYFIHILYNVDFGTSKSICDKYEKAYKHANDQSKKLIIYICILGAGASEFTFKDHSISNLPNIKIKKWNSKSTEIQKK